MRSDEQLGSVLSMFATGLSDYEIARRSGVPRSTVQRWRKGSVRAPVDQESRPKSRAEYAYVLGLYLGDGHIVRRGRSGLLTISLDTQYEDIVEQAQNCLTAVFEPANVHLRDRPAAGTTVLKLASVAVPVAFPQHAAGKKHERVIQLADWQLEVTRAHPRDLIRGLIHSDGCRTTNRFSTLLPSGRTGQYEYTRYFFSNLSADIRKIFCDHCDLLGIRWTQSNPRNISVSRRNSVALLDGFVGPKT